MIVTCLFIACSKPGTVPSVSATVPHSQVCVPDGSQRGQGQVERCVRGCETGGAGQLYSLENGVCARCEEDKKQTRWREEMRQR